MNASGSGSRVRYAARYEHRFFEGARALGTMNRSQLLETVDFNGWWIFGHGSSSVTRSSADCVIFHRIYRHVQRLRGRLIVELSVITPS